jgi:hypothetical protein
MSYGIEIGILKSRRGRSIGRRRGVRNLGSLRNHGRLLRRSPEDPTGSASSQRADTTAYSAHGAQ